MTATEELIDWNGRWKIANGFLSCRTCHAQQKEIDRFEPFEHSPGCSYAGQWRNPWDELDLICKKFGGTTKSTQTRDNF